MYLHTVPISPRSRSSSFVLCGWSNPTRQKKTNPLPLNQSLHSRAQFGTRSSTARTNLRSCCASYKHDILVPLCIVLEARTLLLPILQTPVSMSTHHDAAPSAATEAVLMKSEAMPADAQPVEELDFNKLKGPITAQDLYLGMRHMGFQASSTAEAIRIINDMVSVPTF